MECPYDKNPCSEVNTSGMTMDKECSECKRYNHGIRPTGATPVLSGILEKINKIKDLIIKLFEKS